MSECLWVTDLIADLRAKVLPAPTPVWETRRALLAQASDTPGRVLSLLAWMRRHGSSLSLTWGEDTDLWECVWLAGGRRYTGTSSYLQGAVYQVLQKAAADG